MIKKYFIFLKVSENFCLLHKSHNQKMKALSQNLHYISFTIVIRRRHSCHAIHKQNRASETHFHTKKHPKRTRPYLSHLSRERAASYTRRAFFPSRFILFYQIRHGNLIFQPVFIYFHSPIADPIGSRDTKSGVREPPTRSGSIVCPCSSLCAETRLNGTHKKEYPHRKKRIIMKKMAASVTALINHGLCTDYDREARPCVVTNEINMGPHCDNIDDFLNAFLIRIRV